MDNDALPHDSQPIERRLATILMADVAGYSRLMGENEERTVQVLRGHRQIFDELLRLHRGRIFNTAGDSVLAEFPSAVEAVRCATEIQSALHTRNEHLPPDQRMSFRIGINLGDVIVQGGDLLGDGVNVAARIQSIAGPGGICISGSVYDQIQNKLTLQFKQLGEQSFKNIAQPIRTFSISGTETAPLPVAGRPGSGSRRTALAIGGVVAVVIAIGAAYAFYRSHEASVAEETKRAAEAQRVADAQRSAEQQRRADEQRKADEERKAAGERKAEQERRADQERRLQQDRAAAEAAKREAKLQAELKAAKDSLEQAAVARKADEERKATEAARRAVEAAAQKVREEQAKVAAAAPPRAGQPGAAASAGATAGAGSASPTGADRFDGIYNGRLCNMFVRPEPKTVCTSPPLKIEHGALFATWISGNCGKPAYARGKISPQGNIELTLEGCTPKGDPVAGVMTGTWSDNEITASGAWPGGVRVNGNWKRLP
jgi:class 3 adenylate cyclase